MTTATAVELDIAPLSGTIGAEIRNIDLHRTLDPETLAAVRQALLDYKVIFFPGQHLSPEEHKAFAAHFGEITVAHPVIPGLEDHKEVFEIDYTKARALVGGTGSDYDDRENWHTDVTFVETPPLGSILNAIVIPAAGGDTLWADTQAAYEGLSAADPPVRRRPHRRARRQPQLQQGVGRRRQGRVGRRGVHRARPGRAPGGPHPSRDGPAQPLRQPGLHQAHRGPHRPRERRHPPVPLPPHVDARVRGALPLGRGRPRLLGQPHHHALRHPRLRHRPPRHPARDHPRRPPL